MSIFDRIRLAVAAPLARGLAVEQIKSPYSDSDDLTRWTLDDLLGFPAPGSYVNRTNALRISTVAKARNVIATNVGRLPLFTAKGNQRTAYQAPLLAQPEKGAPLSTTLTWTIDALLFYPCTWWHVLERDAAGWPVWVEWVDRSRVTLDADGKLTAIDNVPVESRDVIRFDSPLGTGLLDIGRDTLSRAVKIYNAVARAEENPVPSIELHSEDASRDLNEEERAKLVQQWANARAKSGVAYTPKSITAKTLGQAAEQLLIDGRKAIKIDLAQHLNVPAWVLDVELDGSSITYQNRQALNAQLIDEALSPYMSAIVDRLSMPDVTPRGWRVKFDTDDLTKPDQKTRFDTYAVGKKAGFITNQWIADQEGWDAAAPDSTPVEQDKEKTE